MTSRSLCHWLPLGRLLLCSRRASLYFLTFSCSFLMAFLASSAAMAEVFTAEADLRSRHFLRDAWMRVRMRMRMRMRMRVRVRVRVRVAIPASFTSSLPPTSRPTSPSSSATK